MAVDEILINAQPGQTRAALLEEGRLVELVLERDDLAGVAGNVYLGRVEKVVAGIEAAFVDIGLERSGFLALPETRPRDAEPGNTQIRDYVSEGDAVLVQVLRDPEPGKGAKLTTRISLPGRFVVFLPYEPGVRLSRRIEDRDLRQRLTDWAEDLTNSNFGLLIRTAALAGDREGMRRDVADLERQWEAIRTARENAKPPCRLHAEPGPAFRSVRDSAGPHVRRIAVDDPALLNQLRTFCSGHAPGLVEWLEGHTGPDPLFNASGVEDQIEEAMEVRVDLPSGGSLIIEEMTALTAVDVNTGASGHGGKESTALATNLEAARELAYQMRLRNLAGLIAVDFVRMKNRRHRQDLLDMLRKAVDQDPRSPHVIGFTAMGLVEITRQKRGESLARLITSPCGHCRGTGRIKAPVTLAFEILRAIPAEAAAHPGANLAVETAPNVIEALQGSCHEALEAVERQLGRPLILRSDPAIDPESYAITTED